MKRSLNQKFVADENKYAFLTAPLKSVRTYDSQLSHPGRMCHECRSFVAGCLSECPICTQHEVVIFEIVAFRKLNHYLISYAAAKTTS